MLLYAAELREGETPLGRAERDETSRGRDGGKGRARGGGGEDAGGIHRPHTGTTMGNTVRAGTAPGEYKGRERRGRPAEFNNGNSQRGWPTNSSINIK